MPVAEVTLEQVARLAGVSASTASRAINGSSRRVRPENEARVRDAALRLGYAVDVRAQATARRRSDVAVIVVPRLTDRAAMRVAALATGWASEHKLAAVVIESDVQDVDSVDRIRWLRGQRPEAIVLVDRGVVHPVIEREFAQFRDHGGQVVRWGEMPD